MIEKLEHWKTVVSDFRDNLASKAVETASGHESFVTDLNVDQMAEAGQDSKGSKIRPRYSASTVIRKRRRGQETGFVTLRDTGDFHRSIFVVFEGDQIVFGADDDKAPKLFAKYGREVLGLDENSFDQLVERVKPDLIDKLKKELFA